LSTSAFEAPVGGDFPVGNPYTGEEIGASLDELHRASLTFFAEFDDEAFVRPQGEFWSPADHVRHLRRSCRPVAKALNAPKLALRARFGRPKAGSQDLEGVVARYHAALAAGGSAVGTVFEPEPMKLDTAVSAWREGLIGRWTSSVVDLVSATAKWSERALDQHQLPHPLLGKMTVREILLFTVYHNAHHVRRVSQRREIEGGANR